MLSVIIPTYNRPSYLTKALASLTKQIFPISEFEVIVINDGGESVQKIVNNFSSKLNLKYIEEKHFGVSHARNIGIKESKGEFLAFFDDDAKADKDWLKNIATALKTEKIIVGRGLPLSSNFWQYFSPHYDRGDNVKNINTIWECNFAVQREVFDRAGEFDEKIDWGYEGNELADHIIKAGYQIKYYPEAVIYHDYALSFANYFYKQYRFGKKVSYLKKKGINISGGDEKIYNHKLENLPWPKKIFIKIIARLGRFVYDLGRLSS